VEGCALPCSLTCACLVLSCFLGRSYLWLLTHPRGCDVVHCGQFNVAETQRKSSSGAPVHVIQRQLSRFISFFVDRLRPLLLLTPTQRRKALSSAAANRKRKSEHSVLNTLHTSELEVGWVVASNCVLATSLRSQYCLARNHEVQTLDRLHLSRRHRQYPRIARRKQPLCQQRSSPWTPLSRPAVPKCPTAPQRVPVWQRLPRNQMCPPCGSTSAEADCDGCASC
jgi:hypothetical protein